MPHAPTKETIQSFASLIRESPSEFVAISDVLPALDSLGIGCRLRCGAQELRSDGRFLALTTSDPRPVVAVHHADWSKKQGDLLEERQQAGPETWEYPLPPKYSVVGEYYLKVSWEGRVQQIPVVNPIPTLVKNCGWGQEIVGAEADAALEATDLAWAVARLLTEASPPTPLARNPYERLRAIRVLEELSESLPPVLEI